MNLTPSPEQAAARAAAQTFVADIGADDMTGWREEMGRLQVERHAPSFFRRLCDAGFVGMRFPPPYGHDASPTERYVTMEQLDAAWLPVWQTETNETIGWMLLRHGPAALAEVHLPKIVSGEWTYAGAYSEPEAGSDMLALTTRAVLDGDAYQLTGRKLWTSSAHLADWIFVLCRSEPDSTRHEGLSLMLVPADAAGVAIHPVPVMGGWQVNECVFDDVAVPPTHVIGEPGQGWAIVSEALNVERAMSFGGNEARLLLTRLLHHLSATGADVGQGDRVRIGQAVADLEVDRLMTLRLATMAERGTIAEAEASMAKVFGSELAQRVAALVVDLLGPPATLTGGGGSALAADAELVLRSSTVLTVIGGTSEIQRQIIARRGLGLPR